MSHTPLKKFPTAEKASVMPFHASENIFLNQLPTAEKIFVIPLHIPEKKLPTEENAAVIPFQALEKTPPNHCAIPACLLTFLINLVAIAAETPILVAAVLIILPEDLLPLFQP